MKPFKTMLKTELKLSLRGLDMFLFAICVPLAVLIILGLLYGNSPASPGAPYTFIEQSFSALATISICAGGMMGLPLVVSDYRSRHILKRYKVTPTSPVLILLVQTTIYTLYALTSLILLYVTATKFFGYRFQGTPAAFFASYCLTLLSMFSIGIMVGGIAPNTKIAGIIASLLYFPALILSGATLPYEIMPQSLQRISDLIPLTQAIKLLKATSLPLPPEKIIHPITITLILTTLCTTISLKFFKWE